MATAIAPEAGTPKPDGMDAGTSTLSIGDTLTVVSGRLGEAWVVEDDNGVVYLATSVE